jgi:hypothetical protein
MRNSWKWLALAVGVVLWVVVLAEVQADVLIEQPPCPDVLR